MTSKISFSKMTRDEMKKLTWLTAVQFLIFGLLIPFRVLLVMATSTSRTYLEMSTATPLEVFCKQVGFGHTENTFFILCAGILCALCAFGYLHSAVKLDFYHSLPIKRESLFAVKFVGSTMTFVTAYLGSQLLALLIGMFHGAVSGRVIFEVAVASFQGILYFLCSYSGTLVAVMLTGKMLTTVLAIGILGLYVPMLYLMKMMFGEMFFQTALYNGIWTGNAEILRYSSPWAFCMFQKNNGVSTVGLTGVWPQAAGFCQVVAVIVIMTGISVLLYRVRKTESAGDALAFRRVESVVKILLTVPVSLVAAMVANELFDSPIWELFFMILFGTLGCMIMEFIYRGDIRQVITHKSHIMITFAVSAVIFFAFRLDVFGYNTYLPAKEELVAMAIKGYEENEYCYWEDGKCLNDADYSYVATPKVLDYLEVQDFEPIYRAAENGVMHAEESYPGDAVRVSIKYRTRDGKESYRTYWVDTELYLDVMDELQKDEAFREKYYPILTWDDDYIRGFYDIECSILTENISYDDTIPEAATEYVENYWYDEKNIEIPLSEAGRVIEAYKKDLENVSYRHVWSVSSSLIFNSYNSDRKYGEYLSEGYPLSAGFTNTLEVLEEIAENAGDREAVAELQKMIG